MIFKMCLFIENTKRKNNGSGYRWVAATPPLLVALQGDEKLHVEAMGVYYALNCTYLSENDFTAL